MKSKKIPGWDKPGDADEYGSRRAEAASEAQKRGEKPLTSNQRAAMRRAKPAGTSSSTSPRGKVKKDVRPGHRNVGKYATLLSEASSHGFTRAQPIKEALARGEKLSASDNQWIQSMIEWQDRGWKSASEHAKESK